MTFICNSNTGGIHLKSISNPSQIVTVPYASAGAERVPLAHSPYGNGLFVFRPVRYSNRRPVPNQNGAKSRRITPLI